MKEKLYVMQEVILLIPCTLSSIWFLSVCFLFGCSNVHLKEDENDNRQVDMIGGVELKVEPVAWRNWDCDIGFSYRAKVKCPDAKTVDSVQFYLNGKFLNTPDQFTFKFNCHLYDSIEPWGIPIESRVYMGEYKTVILYDTISFPPRKPWDDWRGSVSE